MAFLSALISDVQEDGSLIVDLRAHSGALFKYGPFAMGMPWALQEHENFWVSATFDQGLMFASAVHRSRPSLPVNAYLTQWPRDIVELLQPICFAQTPILRLCARYPEARDLARSNINLLWLVAARYAADPSWRCRLPDLLRQRQRVMLAVVLDKPDCATAQLRFLRKVVLTRGDERALEQLRSTVADLSVVRALAHWPRLPSEILDIADGHLLRHLTWLRDRFASTDNRWLLSQYAEETSLLIRDTTRLLIPLEQQHPGATRTLLRSTKPNLQGLQTLHDAALEVLHDANRSDRATVSSRQHSQEISFGPPPLPSTPQFQAITTLADLEEEGSAMRHCVATRAPEVLAGECYIYRVNVCGQRGTLQIGINSNGLQIDEFRLRNNDNPSRSAWDAVRNWLESMQQPA